MHDVARALLIALVLVTAGCSGGSSADPVTTTTAPSGTYEPLTPITLSVSDATATAPDASLRVKYGATTATLLPTDPPTLAEEDRRWVAVHMSVTNRGTEPYNAIASQYVLRADGIQYEYVQVNESWALNYGSDTTIAPNGTRSGWVIFHVPSDVTDATLTVRNATRQTYRVTFEPATSTPELPE